MESAERPACVSVHETMGDNRASQGSCRMAEESKPSCWDIHGVDGATENTCSASLLPGPMALHQPHCCQGTGCGVS